MKNWIKALIIATIIITIPTFLPFLIKKEPEIKSIDQGLVVNVKKPVDTSSWIEYYNSQLGFLIKIPPESHGVYRCSPRKAISVPVKVFEDNSNNAVYIAEEYYYDAHNYGTDKEGECEKIIQSLESFKEVAKETEAQKPFLGWKIIINKTKDEEEVLKYIKENFGSQCIIQSELLKENGNYEILLIGEGKKAEGDPWYGSCYLGFAYKIIYSPDKQKMMSVVLGQEGTFQTNPEEPSTYQYYEDEMLKSFKFE
jgi:hypothetical protein